MKILFYDLETSPYVAYSWGPKWETNLIEVLQEMQLLSFSWKWLGEKTTHCLTRADFKDKTDKSLVKALWKLIDEADILIAHNGGSYDDKVANTRFIANQLTPPAPTKSIDTKKVAKRYFRFSSNSLNDLGQFLGLGSKVKHDGFDLWKQCMAGNSAAFKKMAEYNKGDIVLLEKVYYRFLPWIQNHPNWAVYSERPDCCPTCGVSGKFLISRGTRDYHYKTTTKYRRFQCKKCNGWCRSKTAEKNGKPNKVNL